MVIRFETIPMEPPLSERKKPVAVANIERPAAIENPQQLLPYAKPAPRGNAKSRRERPD